MRVYICVRGVQERNAVPLKLRINQLIKDCHPFYCLTCSMWVVVVAVEALLREALSDEFAERRLAARASTGCDVEGAYE